MKIYTGRLRLIKKRENGLYRFRGRKFFVIHNGTYYHFAKWNRILQVVNAANAKDLEVYVPSLNTWEGIRLVEYEVYRNGSYSFIVGFTIVTKSGYFVYDVEACADFRDHVDQAKFADFTKAIFGQSLSQKEYARYIHHGSGVSVPEVPMFMERTYILDINA